MVALLYGTVSAQTQSTRGLTSRRGVQASACLQKLPGSMQSRTDLLRNPLGAAATFGKCFSQMGRTCENLDTHGSHVAWTVEKFPHVGAGSDNFTA